MPVPSRSYMGPQGVRSSPMGRTSSRKRSKSYMVPRVRISKLGKFYNKVRWTFYFLPIFGMILIVFGLYLVFTGDKGDLPIYQTIIVGAAIFTYLAIYYNKR
ncbi:MAG: hypothetical protein KAJ51_12250 [Thermoplasmata archaeon]|nr:hypothetical protein [Thermoplasmata archaeon]